MQPRLRRRNFGVSVFPRFHLSNSSSFSGERDKIKKERKKGRRKEEIKGERKESSLCFGEWKRKSKYCVNVPRKFSVSI